MMVASPMWEKYGNHLRVRSLPSTSHPLTATVEEELNKLRDWLASNSSSLNTTEVLEDGFGGLAHLYDIVDDMLQLPHTQQLLIHHRDGRCVENALDGTLRVLDVSGTTRDVLLQMKEHVQQTESALRRRRIVSDVRNEFEAYLFSSRKINKFLQKYIGELRKMESENSYCPVEEDKDLVAVVTVLQEVEAITLSICESLLYFVSGSRPLQRQKSLVSKLMHSKSNICEEQHEVCNEVEMVHAAILSLNSHSYPEVATMRNAQKRLELLEASISKLEERLEVMFRTLIRTRVTLLNILSS